MVHPNGLFYQVASLSSVLVSAPEPHSSHVIGPLSMVPCLLQTRHMVQFATGYVNFVTANEFALKIKNIQGDKGKAFVSSERLVLIALPYEMMPKALGFQRDNRWAVCSACWLLTSQSLLTGRIGSYLHIQHTRKEEFMKGRVSVLKLYGTLNYFGLAE